MKIFLKEIKHTPYLQCCIYKCAYISIYTTCLSFELEREKKTPARKHFLTLGMKRHKDKIS